MDEEEVWKPEHLLSDRNRFRGKHHFVPNIPQLAAWPADTCRTCGACLRPAVGQGPDSLRSSRSTKVLLSRLGNEKHLGGRVEKVISCGRGGSAERACNVYRSKWCKY
ncbi:uncharacterized protein MCYG_01033 [Microsporum canis CBS 113480]|uniref:Uncharacterized protein n=1 Tax=Arthroderma otae (strain ATCC MYA-4605 / CBS 113480) TaxID=554155 RepID=C5FEB1_ARTOC|nr:uncharacterized protein MCYG_01033 [Microsporum canis CBS 113480]EEQ28145.1 predicted protein [Microsporum canis CBS 113480]